MGKIKFLRPVTALLELFVRESALRFLAVTAREEDVIEAFGQPLVKGILFRNSIEHQIEPIVSAFFDLRQLRF